LRHRLKPYLRTGAWQGAPPPPSPKTTDRRDPEHYPAIGEQLLPPGGD
jgi:hypothetical protein